MKYTALILTALITVVLLMAGCASPGYKKAAVTTTSIEETAFKLQQGYEQIDTVLNALSSLIHSPEADIRRQFEEFNAEVKKLETLSNEVNTNAAAMKVQGADYFRKWDEELAKIQNENIRQRSTERKNMVAARFDRVRANYARTKDDFAPFMSDLMDIRTALAMDLTEGGLNSIRNAYNKANENARPLSQSLSDLIADLNSLGLSLSTTTHAQ